MATEACIIPLVVAGNLYSASEILRSDHSMASECVTFWNLQWGAVPFVSYIEVHVSLFHKVSKREKKEAVHALPLKNWASDDEYAALIYRLFIHFIQHESLLVLDDPFRNFMYYAFVIFLIIT